ncbi:MAG: amino acid permease [Deltaproteobacteria bacterium]|nr:amino acid permease [Deltaproteobacteria bacterium]
MKTKGASGDPAPERRIGLTTATGLVVASMIGTGVFTTTGLLVSDIPSAMGILWVWLVSGVAALCGALAYAELGAAFAQSGGEYHFLSRLFHPALGFVSAWSSLIVGFSAPLAAVALAFGNYLGVFLPGLAPKVSGALLIVLLSAVNIWRVSAGTGFQNLFTLGKVVLIVAFVAMGLTWGDPGRLVASGQPPLVTTVVSPGFAIGLLWVSFAYTGWNASAYVAGEVKNPGKVLPLALFIGTATVTLLYVAINAVFLAAAPLEQLAGKVEVAHVAATHLLGAGGARVISGMIALGLVSTVGAIIVTGPRVYEAVGRDHPKLAFLARRSNQGGPVVAIGLQSVLALVMMATARFETLLIYIGFTLSIFAALTVGGVFVLRRRPDIEAPYRMWGYPVTPCLFVALMAWMVLHGIVARPVTALAGFGTMATGLLVYAFVRVRPGAGDRPGQG